MDIVVGICVIVITILVLLVIGLIIAIRRKDTEIAVLQDYLTDDQFETHTAQGIYNDNR